MKWMICPVNGQRPISEFAYAGAVRPMPDPETADDATWASYVYNRNNAPGAKLEWWCHTPSTTWFIAHRDTATDQVLETFLFDIEKIRALAAEPLTIASGEAV